MPSLGEQSGCKQALSRRNFLQSSNDLRLLQTAPHGPHRYPHHCPLAECIGHTWNKAPKQEREANYGFKLFNSIYLKE
jgi:hypothetical protein